MATAVAAIRRYVYIFLLLLLSCPAQASNTRTLWYLCDVEVGFDFFFFRFASSSGFRSSAAAFCISSIFLIRISALSISFVRLVLSVSDIRSYFSSLFLALNILTRCIGVRFALDAFFPNRLMNAALVECNVFRRFFRVTQNLFSYFRVIYGLFFILLASCTEQISFTRSMMSRRTHICECNWLCKRCDWTDERAVFSCAK